MIEADEIYITRRIIDACLRENLFGLLDSARLTHELPQDAPAWDEGNTNNRWLQIKIAGGTAHLPVVEASTMQRWLVANPVWWVEDATGWRLCLGYRQWLRMLAADRDEQTQDAFEQYVLEADIAVEHRRLCREAFNDKRELLKCLISDAQDWSARMLFSDQIASYLDHPYYPTARAKPGFGEQEMRQYAPEFTPEFQLRWIAVDKQRVSVAGSPPSCWPSMSDVGLPDSLKQSHRLFPIHPVSWENVPEDRLGVIKAPLTAVTVIPTLSVRTVAVANDPYTHIKVPLEVRTLGTRNVRLIKPSTIIDGHNLSLILQRIEQIDVALRGRYQHCDEEHGAHFDGNNSIAYIVRRYPEPLPESCSLVPVAALVSPMPNGDLYLQQLLDTYYQGDVCQWLGEYLDLMLGVHLRLWLRYGIALEANQQNAVLVFDHERPLTLVMKDNDSARLWPRRLLSAVPEVASTVTAIQDQRIKVEDELPLAQMFCTITLQLNISAIFEAMIKAGMAQRSDLYGQLRLRLRNHLDSLESEGIRTKSAQDILFADRLYVKYLLTAGSLLSKQQSGAADINKYYGLSAPNFLKD
ncbi:IucA/IucC family protein [Microbulbifer epialgicus]|uniref:IucA/IucC family protein n=1 Tax=Microbulbifer epialgicus TaxID=393907 RepID=A0ABV4P1D2_9GAMM